MATAPETIREKVRDLAEHLPPNATWDDVMYQVAVRRSVEQGLKESEAGQTIPHEEILKEFGLAE
jgi:predicted transcriptional regulator